MPQPYGDMKPVEDREPIDASVEKDAPQPGTAVGERRQRRALGPPDRIEAAADQYSEVRLGLRRRRRPAAVRSSSRHCRSGPPGAAGRPHYGERHRAGLRVGTALTEGTANWDYPEFRARRGG